MAIGAAGEEQNAALARAVIGGLLFATPTTLLVVPYLFAMLRKRQDGKTHHGVGWADTHGRDAWRAGARGRHTRRRIRRSLSRTLTACSLVGAWKPGYDGQRPSGERERRQSLTHNDDDERLHLARRPPFFWNARA